MALNEDAEEKIFSLKELIKNNPNIKKNVGMPMKTTLVLIKNRGKGNVKANFYTLFFRCRLTRKVLANGPKDGSFIKTFLVPQW